MKWWLEDALAVIGAAVFVASMLVIALGFSG